MTENEARGYIKGKLDCMNECGVFNREDSENTDLCDNCHYCYSQGNFGQQKEAFSMAIKALEKQKDDGWIPVEEKLPEDGVIVLTCDNYENIHVMKHYNFYEYPFNIGPEHERYYMPKVWMPLQEPYKESEKE